MTANKTQPSKVSVERFLETVAEARRNEARVLIDIMWRISGEKPVMWGPSIIGFGSQHYRYDTGREGDMPRLAFSPRKAAVTLYFEGFDDYADLLEKLGKHTTSVACLYVNKLEDIDLSVLTQMLERSYAHGLATPAATSDVDEYRNRVPAGALPHFDALRELVRDELPNANEVVSYGIIGYKVDAKRARVFVSGWKDHVAVYPIPRHDESLLDELNPYIKGKGTLWFPLDQPLPAKLIQRTVRALTLDA